MADKVQDLYLPNSVIMKVVREAMPERAMVSKDARAALIKSATAFILYISSIAGSHCEAAKRKTLSQADVLAALRETDFAHYESILQDFLLNFQTQRQKKSQPLVNEDVHVLDVKDIDEEEVNYVEVDVDADEDEDEADDIKNTEEKTQ